MLRSTVLRSSAVRGGSVQQHIPAETAARAPLQVQAQLSEMQGQLAVLTRCLAAGQGPPRQPLGPAQPLSPAQPISPAGSSVTVDAAPGPFRSASSDALHFAPPLEPADDCGPRHQHHQEALCMLPLPHSLNEELLAHGQMSLEHHHQQQQSVWCQQQVQQEHEQRLQQHRLPPHHSLAAEACMNEQWDQSLHRTHPATSRMPEVQPQPQPLPSFEACTHAHQHSDTHVLQPQSDPPLLLPPSSFGCLVPTHWHAEERLRGPQTAVPLLPQAPPPGCSGAPGSPSQQDSVRPPASQASLPPPQLLQASVHTQAMLPHTSSAASQEELAAQPVSDPQDLTFDVVCTFSLPLKVLHQR